jgi:hypothetical protein|tara:strand:- start:2134 stop:2433 length:300 start_codon:yes stop_codon:yes gene_type:complete
MNKDKEQLDSLIHSFEGLIGNPAYKYMLKEFDESCLHDSLETSSQIKLEKFIGESAVKRFIRKIALYAEGIPDEKYDKDYLGLEPENEEFDENENVFED